MKTKNQTKIQWCDLTVNFWEGCTKVSPGCQNCYAEDRDQRYHDGQHWGEGAPRKPVKAGPDKARAFNRLSQAGRFMETPAGQRGAVESMDEADRLETTGEAKRVRPLAFAMSLGDIFDSEVPSIQRIDAFRTIAACDQIDWMLLTKRPQLIEGQMETMLGTIPAGDEYDATHDMLTRWLSNEPPKHVALGTSAELQTYLNSRAMHLSTFPAHRRFISAEPLLGELTLPDWLPEAFQLIITGGESGPRARPCHPRWIQSIHNQAKRIGLPHHHKQWGEWVDTEIVPPPAGWKAEQGQAISITDQGEIKQPTGNCHDTRCLYRAGTKATGAEILNYETGERIISQPLLRF